MAGRLCVCRKLSSFVLSASRHQSNIRKLNSPLLPTSTSNVTFTHKPVQLLARKMTSEAEARAGSNGVVVSGCTQGKPTEGGSVESEPPLSSASMATDKTQMPKLETIQQDAGKGLRGCRGDLSVQEGGVAEGSREVLGEGGGEEGVACEVREGQSESDKFLYLQRGFTSEIFKIEIQNIPKYIGYTVRKLVIQHTHTNYAHFVTCMYNVLCTLYIHNIS